MPRRHHLGLRLLVAACSGCLLALAFAPVGWWPLALPAVVAYLSAQWQLSAGRGALVGFAFGISFFLALMPWLGVVGLDVWLLLSTLCASFNAALGLVIGPISRLPGAPWWVASAWVLMEALRGRIPLGGYPWGEVAFSQADSVLAPWVAAVNMAGLTFLIVALAGLVVDAANRGGTRTLALTGAIALGGSILISPIVRSAPTTEFAVVGVVQGGATGGPVAQRQILQTLQVAEDISIEAFPQPDFVVWPENGTDVDPYLDQNLNAAISATASAISAPILVGAVVETDTIGKVENSGIVWTPDSGPGERYVKIHRVPFGEFIPFRDQLTKIDARLGMIERDFVPGDAVGVMKIGDVLIGNVICYEVAYDDVFIDVIRGGAQMLTVQTNNSTYRTTSQPEQQWDIERLRAIQTGRAIAVASTTGITGFINPDGSVASQLSDHVGGYLVEEVPLLNHTTPSVRLGHLPEILAGLATLTAIIALFCVRRGLVQRFRDHRARTSRSS